MNSPLITPERPRTDKLAPSRAGRTWLAIAIVLVIVAAGVAIAVTRGTDTPAETAGEPDTDAGSDAATDAGEAEESARVDRVRVSAEEGFGYLSPFAYRAGGRGLVRMLLMFDTLTWKDADGETAPLLAESWESSADGTEWRFMLREDARWHDGTPVTADDVAFTFDYVQNGPASTTRSRPKVPVEVAAEGPHEVVMRLDKPVAVFEDAVPNAVPIIPRHVWAEVTDPVEFRGPGALMGSGPYTLEDSDPATGAYLFVANDDYYLGPPRVRRIEYVPSPNQLLALSRGELDLAHFGIGDESVPDEALAPFEDAPYDMLTVPGIWNRTIFFNQLRGFPYDDARFRQAIAHAVDRPELVERILLGRGEVGSMGGLVPASKWTAPDLPTYDHDPVKAGELLDEIGIVDADGDGWRDLPDGSAYAPEMITNTRFNPKTGELVQEYLRAVGINLQIVALDTGAADAIGAEGNYAIALVGHGFGDADPDNLRQRYAMNSPQKDFMRVYGNDNPRFNELAAEQQVTLDVGRRREIAHEMQRLFAEDAVTVSLIVPDRFMVFNREVFDGWYIPSDDLQIPYKQIFMGLGTAD